MGQGLRDLANFLRKEVQLPDRFDWNKLTARVRRKDFVPGWER